MEGKQHLYYALGQLAYAVAKADGTIQPNERRRLQKIVEDGISHHEMDYNVSEIVFSVLEGESIDLETAYKWAMKGIQDHKVFLTDDIKYDFIKILEDIANSFDGVSKKEEEIVSRFKKDLRAL